jgi:hypothetical protein
MYCSKYQIHEGKLISYIIQIGEGEPRRGSPSCPAKTVLWIRNYIFFFQFGSGSYFDLNFGSGFESGSGLFMKNTLEIQII